MTAVDPSRSRDSAAHRMSEPVVFSAEDTGGDVLTSAREAWRFRSFIAYLTKRELRITYLRSYLGWFWSLINPIAEIAIYSLVFGVILAGDRRIPSGPEGWTSFPHFLISGMVVWNFYRATSSKVINNFNSTVKLRRKLYFPPVAPALAQGLTVLIQNSIEVLAVVLFFLVVGQLGVTAIVVVPAALLGTVLGLGVGLMLSVANTRYRDVGYLYGIFLRLFFYLVPIIWSLEFATERISIGWLASAVEWNPFAKLISVSRDGLYLQAWPPLTDWLYVIGWASGVLLIGWTVFARSSADVAEGSR